MDQRRTEVRKYNDESATVNSLERKLLQRGYVDFSSKCANGFYTRDFVVRVIETGRFTILVCSEFDSILVLKSSIDLYLSPTPC